MRTARQGGVTTVLSLFVLVSVTHAHDGDDVYWHTSPDVETCSMVIDPSLTQSQWSRFTRQAGAIVSSKALGSAETLGKRHFKIVIDDSHTPVDQHDPAWINTFTHPDDEDCPLGDAIVMPLIRAQVGVSDNMDVGGFWTTAPGANYGLAGGELKYAFLQREERLPAVAARAGVTVLTGVPDFNMVIYSGDLTASKRIAAFAPYVGLRESIAVATETTSKVDLDRESVAITQGYAGLACSFWKAVIAAEYNVSYVNTLAVTAGVSF